MLKKQYHTKTSQQPSYASMHNQMVDSLMTPSPPQDWQMAELHPSNNKPQLGHEAGTPLGIPALGSGTL